MEQLSAFSYPAESLLVQYPIDGPGGIQLQQEPEKPHVNK